jgi:hypothetical protein
VYYKAVSMNTELWYHATHTHTFVLIVCARPLELGSPFFSTMHFTGPHAAWGYDRFKVTLGRFQTPVLFHSEENCTGLHFV